MTARVVLSSVAQADTAVIVRDLAAKAGRRVAADYIASFEMLYERLAVFPESGARRRELGQHVRIGLVLPYIVAYRYVPESGVVGILRVLHGSRNITRKLLSGAS